MTIVIRHNADPAVVREKRSRLREPHVRPINDLADRIAEAEGLPKGTVPYTDPIHGGIHARAVVLLDNPSTRAEADTGSGLLGVENNDATAANCARAYLEHGVRPEWLVHWNVVPFPVAGDKNGSSSAAERARATAWTREFMALVPGVERVVLLGRMAQDGWRRAGLRLDGVVVDDSAPHCSQRGLNQHGGRARFDEAVRALAEHMTTPPSG